MSEADTVVADVLFDFICEEQATELATACVQGDPFEVPWDSLATFEESLAADVLTTPGKLVASFEMAVDDFVRAWSIDQSDPMPSPQIRIVSLPQDETYDVGQWTPDHVVGRLSAIRGQVTERSDRQLRDVETAFKCVLCGTVTRVPQNAREFQYPHECSGCERQKPGWIEMDTQSEVVNYQELRLQALPEHTDSTANEAINVEMTGDLIGTLNPGDRALINATIHTERKNDKSPIRIPYADAHSIELIDTSHEHVDWEPRLEEIEAIADADNTFEQMVGSLSPDHHGDNELKLALILAMFGGVKKQLPTGGTKRGNSHILIIGDPGTGKSDLLGQVAEIVPRSEIATGKQTSSAGLTAAAKKDDFGDSDSWTLEAGTLVRAHQGVACIDELDKMDPNDRAGMMEAMSEQQISINKAASGILPAETTVISAANPIHGSFDPNMPLDEQLDFDTALLNRFDLVFVMEDEVDEEVDTQIVDRMNEAAVAGQTLTAGGSASPSADVIPEIDPDLLRAYIAYAKTLVPRFSTDAMELIRDDYVELRQSNEGADAPVPVTPRSVEMLHRFSEASARVRLDETVIEEDVQRAINLRDYCYETLGIDPETGELDALRLETGELTNNKERDRCIINVVNRLAESYDECKRVAESDEETDEDLVAWFDEKATMYDLDGIPDGAPVQHVREECMVAMNEEQFDNRYEKLRADGQLYCPNSDEVRTT